MPTRITGRIVDANTDAPVPGASVMIPGTSAAQTTADDGTFTLSLPTSYPSKDAPTILVRRIGYRPETVGIEAGEAFYPITLQQDVLRLESEVVTGLATRASAASYDALAKAPASPAPDAAEELAVDPTWVATHTGVGNGGAPGGGMMVIRTGGASIEVSRIDSAVPRLRALATQLGGYIAASSIQSGREPAHAATLEVKAPAQSFDQLLRGLGPIGKVESVNVSAQDVGEEYVDVEARIANDHRLETRLIELLATRTGKLKDVLDVERELARVREEIERYEGRLRYLRTHAEMSTLSVTVHEPVPLIEHASTNPLAAAARQAWRNFIALVAFAIASLGVLLPIAAVGGSMWFLLNRRPVRTATAAR